MIDKRDAIALLQAHYNGEFEARCSEGDNLDLWDVNDQNFLCECALDRIYTQEIRDMLDGLRTTDDPDDYQALANHGFEFRI